MFSAGSSVSRFYQPPPCLGVYGGNGDSQTEERSHRRTNGEARMTSCTIGRWVTEDARFAIGERAHTHTQPCG